MAKGYRGRANRCYTVAKQRVEKALQYQYRDRKVYLYIYDIVFFKLLINRVLFNIQRKKRIFRQLWIQRINAASRIYGVTYAQLIYKLSHSNIQLNRKVLADIAVTEPLSFKSVIEVAKLVKGPINPKAEEHAAASAAAKAKKAKRNEIRAKSQ